MSGKSKETPPDGDLDKIETEEPERILNEEEEKKKEELELICKRVGEVSNTQVQKNALKLLTNEIRSSTSSVTSIPTVLKLLVDYYDDLVVSYGKTTERENQSIFADLMSVLSMTMGEEGDVVKYKLTGTEHDVSTWGHEYVRVLSQEIGIEYRRREKELEEKGRHEPLREDEILDLFSLINQIIPYLIKSNNEPAAIDLLLEVDRLILIKEYANIRNYKRMCRYLIEMAPYHINPENEEILACAYEIYSSPGIDNYPSAVRIAMMLHQKELVSGSFKNCKDVMTKRQIAFMLARHGVPIEEVMDDLDQDDDDDEDEGEDEEGGDVEMKKESDKMVDEDAEGTEKPEGEEGGDDEDEDEDDWGGEGWESDDEETEDDLLKKILNNQYLSQYFLHTATELDYMEPKDADKDIYKEESSKATTTKAITSAKSNLAKSYVNGFANAGFCKDLLMTDENSQWIYHNKDHGKMGAAASLGLVYLWNAEEGMNRIHRLFYANDPYIQAGALLGMGICSTNVRLEEDACLGVLKKHLHKTRRENRLGAILGLGIAYCGSRHEKCKDALLEIVENADEEPIDIVCVAALALGFIFVGAAHGRERSRPLGEDEEDPCEDILNAMVVVLQTKPRKVLEGSFVRFLCLAIGLLYFGTEDRCESLLEMTVSLDASVSKFLCMIVDICAYAGSGNVLKIQQCLNIVGEHLLAENKKKKDEKAKEEENEKIMKEMDSKKKKEGGEGENKKKEEEEEKKKEEKMEDEDEEKKKKEEEEEELYLDVRYQSIACLGLGLVAMGENIGSDMISRIFNHILHYGEVTVKKAVPLAMALLHISDPKLEVMDVLGKLSHEHQVEVAQSAILALGLIGAGTNNSRLNTILRGIAEYYQKDPHHLYLTRIAQGLVGMGKGLITCSPFVSDRKILRPVAICGLLTVCFGGMDMRAILLNQYHYFLYTLSTAMVPRMLVTVDEDLKAVPISVRVGQAVDVVGKAGRAKTITGFQTHDTPVTLQYNERAEMASLEKHVPCKEILEDVVIVKKVKLEDLLSKQKKLDESNIEKKE